MQPKVGIIFKSYEQLPHILHYARRAEEAGLEGGFWIAEAYHWFRQYGHEARGAMVTLAAATMVTKTIPIGLSIGSPYMRHPVVQASEACALDELSGGRFVMGMGAGKVGINYIGVDLKVHREAIDIFRKAVKGEAYSHKGEMFTSSMPGIAPERRFHRDTIPVVIGATGPFMQKLAGEIADGLMLPGLTSPGFVKMSLKNLGDGFARAGKPKPADYPLGAVILSSISRDGKKAKDAARPYAATYVVNKIRNIQNDEILSSSGITQAELAPLRARIASGNEDVTDLVSDSMLRQFGVVAGTPDEAAEILQGLVDAGLNLPLMELVGEDEQAVLDAIDLLASDVVPQLGPVGGAA
jgi:alkanesulfonate monooxygenase SsuD/methylene tetrahydromethanopterin reductase-like flavin-dependent oxidoreductase (luciferase family)